MATVAGRKKSIIASQPIQIDNPIAQNTLLNKAASQSTSLYQQCSSLRSRLLQIRGFSPFFSIASTTDSRSSTDPVTQLWDVFSFGVPLCYLWNLLPPPAPPIPTSTAPETFDVSNERVMKRSILLFSMQVSHVPDCEKFTVTDLWDRGSTDGLVKVVETVARIVALIPEDLFEVTPATPLTSSSQESLDLISSSTTIVPPQGKEAARNNIIREMVETERKYVADLETMQRYAKELSQSNTIDQDTIHLLFPNLNKLLNFQRKFLIDLEMVAEMPWKEQRWGQQFIENEEAFTVYEPYCANYTNAAELMILEEQNLMLQSQYLNAKTELPAFLIKPVQRICKYPLLLDSLIKASSLEDYPLYEELQNGSLAAKRITDKINEAQRRAENLQTVKNLQNRVEDWKGHHLSNFGDLLLDDIFTVMKLDVDREYHVFLFEKIILCCKEAPLMPPNSAKKMNKTNSLLKKQQTSHTPLPFPGSAGSSKKKSTPLLLKGRIFLNNVTRVVPISPRNSFPGNVNHQYSLEVWWRGDDDLEYFTLRCRTEEQMKQWESHINRLIKEAATRRASERGMARLAAPSTSTSQSRQPYQSHRQLDSLSSTTQPVYMSMLPPRPGSQMNTRSRSRPSPYSSEEQLQSPSGYGNTQGYPPSGGFEFEPDDDFEESSNYPASGRGTPMDGRRHTDATPGRARTRMGDRQESSSSFVSGLPPASLQPMTPRLPSNSLSSNASESNFGGPAKSTRSLRSQFSSTKLKSTYDDESRSSTPAPPMTPALHSGAVGLTPTGHPTGNRSRSASQPSTYVPKSAPPPLPTATQWASRPGTSMTNKRGSGSSQSTDGNSSDYSPNSSSPITPFGSSESSLGGISSRKNSDYTTTAHLHLTPPVKVKVHFHEDIFVVQVPRDSGYAELVERVGKKIRLCGRGREDGPLRVKYRDEDGDMISLGSTEDVQMAFESWRPGSQIIVYVQ